MRKGDLMREINISFFNKDNEEKEEKIKKRDNKKDILREEVKVINILLISEQIIIIEKE
jgi:hypothetical protein